MRNRRLVQMEPGRTVANEHLVLGPSERCEDAYARRVRQRFQESRLFVQVAVVDRRLGTAPLY